MDVLSVLLCIYLLGYEVCTLEFGAIFAMINWYVHNICFFTSWLWWLLSHLSIMVKFGVWGEMLMSTRFFPQHILLCFHGKLCIWKGTPSITMFMLFSYWMQHLNSTHTVCSQRCYGYNKVMFCCYHIQDIIRGYVCNCLMVWGMYFLVFMCIFATKDWYVHNICFFTFWGCDSFSMLSWITQSDVLLLSHTG